MIFSLTAKANLINLSTIIGNLLKTKNHKMSFLLCQIKAKNLYLICIACFLENCSQFMIAKEVYLLFLRKRNNNYYRFPDRKLLLQRILIDHCFIKIITTI